MDYFLKMWALVLGGVVLYELISGKVLIPGFAGFRPSEKQTQSSIGCRL